MAEINRKKCSVCLFFAAGLVFGLILGVLGLATLVSYRIDKYYERIRFLEATIEDKNIKMEKLNESLNKKIFVLKDIQIIFVNDIDDMVKLTLQKYITEKYVKLIGKEVKEIDAELIEQVVHNRIMKLEDIEYKLKFNKLIIGEVMKLWLQVETIN